MKIHPGDRFLRDTFGAKDLPADHRRALLDHLRACARCRERLRDILHPLPAGPLARRVAERLGGTRLPAPGSGYDKVIDRAAQSSETRRASLARERAEAPKYLERLLDQPPERRDLLLRNHPRYQTWSLAELILERSAEEALRGSRPSEELGRLALAVTERLDRDYYGTERIEDLKARSWSRIGNALRIRSDLAGAEAAFERGFAHLRRGTGDPMEKATCLDLKASLLRAQRRLREATRTQETVVAIFLEIGEKHRAGRALLNLETIVSVTSTLQEAVPLLLRAVALIDSEREPRLMFFACHNLADSLTTLGRIGEAMKLLRLNRHLYQRFTSPSVQCRRLWLEGKIAARLGHRSAARTLLRSAREGFLREERAQEAKLVGESLRALAGRRMDLLLRWH